MITKIDQLLLEVHMAKGSDAGMLDVFRGLIGAYEYERTAGVVTRKKNRSIERSYGRSVRASSLGAGAKMNGTATLGSKPRLQEPLFQLFFKARNAFNMQRYYLDMFSTYELGFVRTVPLRKGDLRDD